MTTAPLQFPKPNGSRFTMPTAGVQQMLDRAPSGNSDVAAALRGLAGAYARVLDNHQRVLTDGTLTPHAQLVRSARAARSALTPAVEALRKARDTAAGARADCERQVAKVFDYSGDFSAVMVAAEIRSHFASLPAGDRMAAVGAAIAGKDATTLKAIGAGPPYLSGLPADRHDFAKNALVDLLPDVQAARDAAKALGEQEQFCELFETTLLQSVADAIDMRQAASYEATATAAMAAA